MPCLRTLYRCVYNISLFKRKKKSPINLASIEFSNKKHLDKSRPPIFQIYKTIATHQRAPSSQCETQNRTFIERMRRGISAVFTADYLCDRQTSGLYNAAAFSANRYSDTHIVEGEKNREWNAGHEYHCSIRNSFFQILYRKRSTIHIIHKKKKEKIEQESSLNH